MTVSRGQLIFERGGPPGGLFGIIDGFVSAGTDNSNISVVAGHIFKPGDWFGEIPTLTNGPRQVNETAQREGTLLAINSSVAIQIACDILIARSAQTHHFGDQTADWGVTIAV